MGLIKVVVSDSRVVGGPAHFPCFSSSSSLDCKRKKEWSRTIKERRKKSYGLEMPYPTTLLSPTLPQTLAHH